MNVTLVQIPVGDSSKKSKQRRRKRRSKKQAVGNTEAEIRDQMDDSLEASDKIIDYEVSNNELRKNPLETDLAVQPLADNPKVDTGSIENLSEGNANRKKKKRLKRKKKKATINDELQSIDWTKMDTGSTENLTEGTETAKRKKKRKSIKKAEIKDEVQSMDQAEIDTGTTENLAEGNVTGKRKRKRRSIKKEKLKDEVQSVVQTKMDTGSTENIIEGNAMAKREKERESIKKAKTKDEVQSMDQAEMDTEPTQNLAEGNVAGKRKRKRKSIKKAKLDDEVQNVAETKMDTGSTENVAEGNATTKRKRKKKRSKKAKSKDEVQSMSLAGSTPFLHLSDENHERRIDCKLSTECNNKESESHLISHPNRMGRENEELENGLAEVNNEIVFDQGKRSAEGRNVLCTCNVEATHLASCDVKDADCLCSKMAPTISIRRKLLVLDINGLLADIVKPAPKHRRADIRICGRAIFRRPFCGDFLKFCFQNFDVGIWSSRSKRIIKKVVDYLLGDLKHKLLFCWDMSHSTRTGARTLENRTKPLVCKELRKIWDKDGPKLRWKKGDYNELNTLLLDDSPYKALLNPLHTAIFPCSYRYEDKNDNSLGPEGDLRVYLKGLVTSENVQKYVEQHPFGQSPITKTSLSWEFYAGVLDRVSNRLKIKVPIS